MFGKLTYAPHKLYLVRQGKKFDSDGNFEGVAETVELVGDCRCDDAGVRDAITVNGERFFPSYHIVSGKKVANGATVRVLADDGSVRAEGKVIRTAYSNYFKMYQVWI